MAKLFILELVLLLYSLFNNNTPVSSSFFIVIPSYLACFYLILYVFMYVIPSYLLYPYLTCIIFAYSCLAFILKHIESVPVV